MNNKNFTKKGSKRALLLFLYKVSLVVLINFIAILLTPGIFLIQIVNRNMYLIHFYSKNNIKMHFPESLVFKLKLDISHSLHITTWWNKLRWHQQRLHNNTASQIKKNKYILIIIIYIVKHFDRFFDTFFKIFFF